MQALVRRPDRRGQKLLVGGLDDFVSSCAAVPSASAVAATLLTKREMRCSVYRLCGDGELLIVMLSVLGIAEYAAGMIDETQGLFYVALAVACFRIIFSDQATQRGPHLFVRCELRYSQCLVERCLHRQSQENARNLTLECSGKPVDNASYR
jgi:hypothetical protein